MLLELSESLPNLVEKAYKSAKASGKIVFSPTEVTIIKTTTGVPFQLRYLSSLSHKPVTPDSSSSSNNEHHKPSNPFANPDPGMVITDLPPRAANPTHFLLLNKFPIIPQHFMLITKAPQPQTAPLEADDLAAAYACLEAWTGRAPDGCPRRLFAFFNSGPHSGASQAHRHVQFLPVEALRAGLGDWELLMDRLTRDADDDASGAPVPFAYFSAPLPPHPSPGVLSALYAALLAAVQRRLDGPAAPGEDQDPGALAPSFSYNLALTTSAMLVCPRRAEAMPLRSRGDEDRVVGRAALNGTMLAGSMLVKSREEWEALRSGGKVLDEVLKGVGVPWEEQEEEGKRGDNGPRI